MSTSPKVPFRKRIGEMEPSSPHLRGMGRYRTHAYWNARSVAELLDKQFGAGHARQVYESSCPDQVREYEQAHWTDLAEFMRFDDSQRLLFVRELPDERTQIGFLVLAILGAGRAASLLTLRDKYREVLAPVRGEAETTSAIYELTAELLSLHDYGWPANVFAECRICDQSMQRARHLKLVEPTAG